MCLYLCVCVCVSAHLDAKKAGDLSTLFDVGGIVGRCFCSHFSFISLLSLILCVCVCVCHFSSHILCSLYLLLCILCVCVVQGESWQVWSLINWGREPPPVRSCCCWLLPQWVPYLTLYSGGTWSLNMFWIRMFRTTRNCWEEVCPVNQEYKWLIKRSTLSPKCWQQASVCIQRPLLEKQITASFVYDQAQCWHFKPR